MYLKKLELTGFKSFADRTQLELSKGLNVVVGPNGSGKSNIADALRWVLGEQSAKQLRGGKMEDVIFAGTAHRRPLGYAEIVMRIDNIDKKLPLEFSEISVARRVYRSGESEYSINGETCRLKDIQMLFMDTGVGRDGYSIIGQGRIDEILSLRSEDRRLVFEEAAGIGKFKSRRNEALSKLEKEKQNRERVEDIISELDEQIEPLETQAEEAKRYLSLRDQHKEAHINIFLTEISKIETELKQVDENIALNVAQLLNEKQQLQQVRQANEDLKLSAQKADLEYRQAHENLLEITTSLEKADGDSKLLDNKYDQALSERDRLKNETEKRTIQAGKKSDELISQQELKNKFQEELDKLNHELEEHIKLSEEKESSLRGSSSEMDVLNQAILDVLTESANSRANITEAENVYLRLEDDKEKLDSEIIYHDTKVEEQMKTEADAILALEKCKNELDHIQKNVDAYTQAYGQLVDENKMLDIKLRDAQETLTISRGRYKAIESLEAQHEGFYQSVKAVLRKKATDPSFDGICGAVSELIGVMPEHEIAIETALGGAAQNIVTKTENDAKLAINMLKESKNGRATFLPLTAVKGKSLNITNIANAPGFINTAAGLVRSDDQYSQIVTQLLGDVIVMDNIDNALAFNKKHKYSYKIVTLQGERLSPGGAITGGATNKQTTSLIGRGRQVEELKQKVETLTNTLSELTQTKQLLREKRQTTEETLKSARENEQNLILETERLKDKLTQSQEALNNLSAQANAYEHENNKIMQALIEANANIRVMKKEHSNREQDVAIARKNLEEYQQQLEHNRQEQTEEADIMTEIKINISRHSEWIGEALRNIERLQREKNILEAEKTALNTEIVANEAAIKEYEANRGKSIDTTEILKQRADEIRLKLHSTEQKKEMLDVEMNNAEKNERSVQDSSQNVERELTRLEMRKEQLDATSHRLHDEVWEEYSLTYQQALAHKRIDINETALRRLMQDLRTELATLTNVNLGAIEAFKQVKTRHDFLVAQLEDIQVAENALIELIQQLTGQMEDQFSTQFKLIGMHFEEVFRQMFSGGKASLRLLDTDNVLESGIEITAQPPGKSLQNLMLLSGGERALTAIALLFSILKLKPSPFCVLDEIESALDDANVVRFASYLKEYAKGTQFIIITHRKGTMEAAEHMYGVTMEEQGISKLVSVKFDEGI